MRENALKNKLEKQRRPHPNQVACGLTRRSGGGGEESYPWVKIEVLMNIFDYIS